MRQAWPFLTLCDNAPTSPRETRLYIGTSFRVGSSPQTFTDGDPEPAVAQLLELNNAWREERRLPEHVIALTAPSDEDQQRGGIAPPTCAAG